MTVPVFAACAKDSCPSGRILTEAGACVLPEDGGASPCSPSCTAPTPHCNAPTGQCVECLTNNDCPIEHAVCTDTNTCIGCRNDADCTDRPETPTCNPTSGRCTTCQTDTACTAPSAARCDTDMGRCVPCTESAQCAGVEGAPVCNDGACVECTPETETTHCEGNSCNPETSRCTATPVGSVGTCGACVADSECMDSHACVPLQFQGTSVGGHCLQERNGGCARPYRTDITSSSVSDSTSRTFCGINQMLTTCEAILALIVEGKTCSVPADCVEQGARCEDLGGTENECTYECESAFQCPNSRTCAMNFCGS